jgi:acetolactate synthase-1/2/3 large subunit
VATVAGVLAAALRDEGVQRLFGFPGGPTVELAEGARRAGLDFVLAHSEWSAGYMACMHGELLGRPGVLLVTQGPGATNAVNATANALLDRSPMLVLSGRAATTSGTHAHQRLNQVSLFEPVTKWSTTVEPASFPAQLARALRLARAERPGPVHLDLPGDVAGAECGEWALEDAVTRYGVPQDIEEAAGLLHGARRPLLIAGVAALRLGAGSALARLAEAWSIPVVTTAKAKGVLPESHPLWAGVIDVAGHRLMNRFLASTDLHLAVGFDGVEVIGSWEHRIPTVHLDLVPNTDLVYGSRLDLVGDPVAALEALASLAPGSPRWEEAELVAHRQELRRRLQAPTGFSPSRAVLAAREVVDDKTVVVSDVGSHKLLLAALWRTECPRTFFCSNGLGTMGFGLPAAIAARLLQDQPVVAFLGDGGFAMVASELGTALDLGLPVVAVVFADGALDRILRRQQARGWPAVGTRFGNPDLCRLAEAFGAAGFRAENEAELQRSMETALGLAVPSLIDVRIDPDEYRVQFEA